MSHYRRPVLLHSEWSRLLAIVQERLDDLKYYDEDFEMLYKSYLKLSSPQPVSERSVKVNLAPAEHAACFKSVADVVRYTATDSDNYMPITRLFVKLHDAKSYPTKSPKPSA